MTPTQNQQTTETLGGLLRDMVRRYGDRPALVTKPRYRTEAWSYARLWTESGRVARVLQDRGVRQGDRVLLWAPNSPQWVAVYFGAARIGAVVCPLDMRSTDAFVAHLIEQTQPALAVVSRTVPWKASVPTLVIEDVGEIAQGDGEPDEVTVQPGDIAEILFTSGTTGEPKGVMLTHRNITSNAASVDPLIPSIPDFRLLSVLPLSHMLEQTVGLLLPLNRGGSIFYPPGRQSSILFRSMQERRVTAMLLVPQAMQLFLDAVVREVRKSGKEKVWNIMLGVSSHLPIWGRRMLFRSLHKKLGGELQFFVSGGAALDVDLIRRWELLGIRILQGYGATETAPVISATPWHDPRPASVGIPVRDVEVRVAADGELLVRGPSVMPGYWNNREATAAALEDGWYHTGDLGELDADGYVYLRGRKKNMIVLSNGQNVYPEDIERVLGHMQGVIDCVVLGVPGPQGVRVHAVLLLEPQTDATSIVRAANDELAAHQRIAAHSVWPDPDFPRTHTLKVKRHDVLRDLQAHQERDAATATQEEPQRDDEEASPLRRVIAELAGVPVGQIAPQTRLGDDLRLDSLGRVELLAAIEAEIGAYIDEASIDDNATVGDLERLVGTAGSSARPVFPQWPIGAPARAVRPLLQRALFRALTRIAPARVLGTEIFRSVTGPVLIVANHSSHLDAPTVLKALPVRYRRRVALAAAADYFFARRWLGIAVGLLLNAFPFSRTTAVRPTLEHCASLLDNGWSIILFPEGTRSPSGEMAPFKSGVGLLAVELGVPVIPMGLKGLHDVLPKGRTVPQKHEVIVRFGEPLRFEPGTAYEAAAEAVEHAVRGLAGQGSPATSA
jgi:long-chain acyl-CoA synthetase